MTPDDQRTPSTTPVPGVDRALIDDISEIDVNAEPVDDSPPAVLIVPAAHPRRRLVTAGPILFLLSAGLLVLAVRLPTLIRPTRADLRIANESTLPTDVQPSPRPLPDPETSQEPTDSAIVDVLPLGRQVPKKPTAADPDVVASVHIESPLDRTGSPAFPPLPPGDDQGEGLTASPPLTTGDGEGETLANTLPPISSDSRPTTPLEELTDQAWADIRRESERIAAERAAMSNAKAIVLQQEALAKHQAAASKRTAFLERLRALADRPDGSLRPLTLEAPRPDILNQNEQPRLLALSRNRSLRMTWIVRLRAMGIEESAILDELGRAHALNANLRGGPATFNDALRRAAVEILASPIEVPPLPQSAKPPVARDGGRRLTPPASSSPASTIYRRRLAPG